jgi:HSP20 family molecular chaperone IbpA
MNGEEMVTKPSAEEAAKAERTRCGRCYRPNVDILEKADELLVQADVPGAKPDEIDVKFEDGTLSIFAKVGPRQAPGAQYLLNEYGVGDYYRTFEVTEAVDASKITAECADGVLTLHLPKAESLRPRKIKVQG